MNSSKCSADKAIHMQYLAIIKATGSLHLSNKPVLARFTQRSFPLMSMDFYIVMYAQDCSYSVITKSKAALR